MGGELFSLFAKLTLDTSEFDQNTDRAKEKASVFGDVLAADLVGKGISLAFDGLKKLGGAIKDFTTDAVMSYGEIEQLRGGIETLFGESAPKVLADADAAFKTAGMSASQYMDTSIQSAASLINSLGGDQAKAAELMNMSITDMADNVNKMGTSMEGVQNAYRGFSRGNFTMLDNLALGFAGTKEGMQSLLDKAEEISGFKYDISSYADIVEAIHVVQGEMGITGTTSREAAETIQGSLSSMKSAWENLIAGIADPEANLGDLITNFVESGETALDNLVPAVGRALSGIGIAVKRLAPVALEKIPEIFSDLAPDLGEAALAMVEYVLDAFGDNAGKVLDAGAEWVSQFVAGFGQGIPKFLQMALPMLLSFAGSLRKGAKQLAEAGVELIKGLADGVDDNTSYIVVMAHQIIENFFGAFMDSVPMLFDAGLQLIQTLGESIGENIPNFIGFVLPLIEQFSETFREGAGNLVDVGIEFILNLAQGIMDSLPMLIEQVPQIVINFAGAINDNAPKVLVGGVQLVITIIKGIISAIPTLVANIPKIFEAILAVWTALNWVNLGKSAIEFIHNGIDQLRNNLPQAIKDIGNRAIEWFKGVDWAHAGTQAINFIKSAILAIATHIPTTVMSIASKAIEWFTSVDWASAGSNAITYIKNAIVGLTTKIPNELLNIANKAWDWFNDVDWYDLGSNIIDGIVQGLEDGVRWIKDAAMSVAQKAKDAAENLLGIASPSKVFRYEIGQMIPKGLALGIDDAAAEAIDSARRLSEGLLNPFDGATVQTVAPAAENGYYSASQMEYINAIGDAVYMAMRLLMSEGGFVMNIDGRELGRLLRDNGVVMA